MVSPSKILCSWASYYCALSLLLPIVLLSPERISSPTSYQEGWIGRNINLHQWLNNSIPEVMLNKMGTKTLKEYLKKLIQVLQMFANWELS